MQENFKPISMKYCMNKYIHNDYIGWICSVDSPSLRLLAWKLIRFIYKFSTSLFIIIIKHRNQTRVYKGSKEVRMSFCSQASQSDGPMHAVKMMSVHESEKLTFGTFRELDHSFPSIGRSVSQKIKKSQSMLRIYI
jgi:hypothetical protein